MKREISIRSLANLAVYLLCLVVVAQSGLLAYLFISDRDQNQDIKESVIQIQQERRDSLIRSCISDSKSNDAIQRFVERLAPDLEEAVTKQFPTLSPRECVDRADDRVNQNP
jgi:hypothetical protein